MPAELGLSPPAYPSKVKVIRLQRQSASRLTFRLFNEIAGKRRKETGTCFLLCIAPVFVTDSLIPPRRPLLPPIEIPFKRQP